MRNKKTFFIGILIILLIEVIFFRSYLYTGVLFGDAGDGLLNNLIVEHWYQVFRGCENIDTLNIFYPITNTISYTDMLFGLALPYGFLRALGLNMFIANKIVLISMHIFGVLTYFYLLNRQIKLSLPASIIGCVLVFLASNFYAKVIHTQFFVMGFVPLLLLLLSIYYDKLKILSKQRFLFGVCSVLTLAFILYSSWYVGFFFCLFSFIFILTFVVIEILHSNIKGLKILLLNNVKEVMTYFFIAIISLIPFMKVYLPTAKLTGKWTWNAVKPMLPSVYDFINVSGNNLLYGHIFSKTFFTSRELSWELCLGFPIVTLLVFFIASYYYVKYLRQKDKLLSLICIATLLSFLLLIKIKNISLWYLVFKFVPGGGAIRAASRYMFFLSFPISFIIANFYDSLMTRVDINKYKLQYLCIGIIVPLFFLLENIHDTSYVNNNNNSWTIYKQQNYVSKIGVPNNNLPFYITNSKPKEHTETNYEYQLHSWLIANKYNLKTINGYSGKFPLGWNLYDINDKQYQSHVDDWMMQNNISALQRYDIATGIWKNYTVGHH